jgi:hypothetical protein
VAPAPAAPPGRPGPLRGDPPLTERPSHFQVDDRRLYEVGPAGGAWTAREDPEARARRLKRLRWLFAIGIGANAATGTLAGLALLFGPDWGASFGVLAMLTLPLLALPVVVEATAWLKVRRRHATRPDDFPRG